MDAVDNEALDAYSQVVTTVADKITPRVASVRVRQRRRGGQAEGAGSAVVLTGDYGDQSAWSRVPVVPGTPLEPPTPIFTKLDPSVVDDELARLEQSASSH